MFDDHKKDWQLSEDRPAFERINDMIDNYDPHYQKKKNYDKAQRLSLMTNRHLRDKGYTKPVKISSSPFASSEEGDQPYWLREKWK